VFTLASAGCAGASGFGALVAWRVLQGFAGGTLIPAVFSAVFLLFPERLHGIATTLAGVIAVLAPTLGPVVGGWITETYSWHWLFLINILPGVVAMTTAGFLIPAGRPEWRHLRRLDWPSLLLMAVALAALEIGLKEAPKRGWMSVLVLGLLAATAAAGAGFVIRSIRAHHPVVELSTLRDQGFAIGCFLSFVLGIGLFGTVYLMPVFLAFVRGHGSLRIGEIMLVTGVTQLIAAPLAVALERRAGARLLTALGFATFATGIALDAFDTRATDLGEMFWPQVVRGSAIMFCLLPPTRLALGHLAPDLVPDASGLFNLMRNLGGAIGIALIDTVLYGRAPIHAEALIQRLKAGDPAAAAAVGLPRELVAHQAQSVDSATLAFLSPLVEKAAFVTAVDEAWAMVAALVALGLVIVPFATRGRRNQRARPTP
jgi:DHA2 family multidrug resistance protein